MIVKRILFMNTIIVEAIYVLFMESFDNKIYFIVLIPRKIEPYEKGLVSNKAMIMIFW